MDITSIKNGLVNFFKIRIVYHTVFWAFQLFYTLYGFNAWFVSIYFALEITFTSLILKIFVVYIHFFLIERYLYNKKYLNYVILLSILIIAGSIGSNIHHSRYFPINNVFYFIGGFSGTVFILFITTSLKLIRRWGQQRFELQEIKEKHLETELKLLKAQANPHFFFNTLNNLFSIAHEEEAEITADGIAKLSHLMRYMIYEIEKKLVPLEKEVQQIGNFIKLQKLRFSDEDNIKISFTHSGDIEDKMIPPMLLIPFAENAFKHGISLRNPSEITISLISENRSVYFNVKNTVFKKEHSDSISIYSEGFGLANVKRRLELLFPESHELKINKDSGFFEISLYLKLNLLDKDIGVR